MFGILGAVGTIGMAAAMAYIRYLRNPPHKSSRAYWRKRNRKLQAQARRHLRDPAHRGNRAEHRVARHQLALTRKPRNRKAWLRPGEVDQSWLGSLPVPETVLGPNGELPRHEIIENTDGSPSARHEPWELEEERQTIVRCVCSRRYTYPEFVKLQMLEQTTIEGQTTHVKACSICGREVTCYVCDTVDGKPRYLNLLHQDAAYQAEESDKRVKEGLDP